MANTDERAKAVRAVVSEIYSPPRVTAASKLLPELKLIPGFALDLTTGHCGTSTAKSCATEP